METIVHFTPKSSNEKIGPIPATVSSENTCPSDCPLKESGCYAKTGPVSWHWNKVSQGLRGSSWSDLCTNISNLKPGQLWRHNVAGDLPGENDLIDPVMLGELVAANMGKKGFTYTHKTSNPENIHWIKSANEWGFTVNLSANNLDHADELADLNAGPVATVLPIDAPKKTETPKGRIVITCPATYRDDVACATCKLCAISSRETIIGFPAHGTSKAKAQKVFFMKRG
jgi:hypothetical protein